MFESASLRILACRALFRVRAGFSLFAAVLGVALLSETPAIAAPPSKEVLDALLERTVVVQTIQERLRIGKLIKVNPQTIVLLDAGEPVVIPRRDIDTIRVPEPSSASASAAPSASSAPAAAPPDGDAINGPSLVPTRLASAKASLQLRADVYPSASGTDGKSCFLPCSIALPPGEARFVFSERDSGEPNYLFDEYLFVPSNPSTGIFRPRRTANLVYGLVATLIGTPFVVGGVFMGTALATSSSDVVGGVATAAAGGAVALSGLIVLATYRGPRLEFTSTPSPTATSEFRVAFSPLFLGVHGLVSTFQF